MTPLEWYSLAANVFHARTERLLIASLHKSDNHI